VSFPIPREPPADRASLDTAARVAELFERHGRMVLGVCRAMLHDVHDAEDATQQTFLSAHRALLGGARIRDTGAWIATIARNECRARISAGMRNPLLVPPDDLAELPSKADDVEQRLRASELVEALAGLSDRQREAVVLRYVHGLRYGEVSKALGLSLPATEALLFRARRAMRIRLRPAAAAILVVPASLRDGLSSALPGFDVENSAGAGAGLSGGLLAKLLSAPVAKIATATVAVSAVGAVGVVQSERHGHHSHQLATVAGETPRLSPKRASSANVNGVGHVDRLDPGGPSHTPRPRTKGGGGIRVTLQTVSGVDAVRPSTAESRSGPTDEGGAPVIDQAPVETEDSGAAVRVYGDLEPSPTGGDSSSASVARSDEAEQASSGGSPDSSSLVSERGPSAEEGSGSDSVGSDGGSASSQGSGDAGSGASSEDSTLVSTGD
jgi:RNA polymerase sigma-70 factor (ECF subfamily)